MKILRFAAITVMIALIITNAGCGPTKSSSSQTSRTPDESQSPDEAASIKKRIISLPEEKKSSIQKISEALRANEINEKTAVLLYIQAVHEKNKLSEIYKNDEGIDFVENLMAEYQWIRNHFNELTADEKTALEPYILPPDNEKSFFHPKNKNNTISLIELLPGTCKVEAADNQWHEIHFSIPGKPIAAVIHYYKDTSDPNAANDLLEQEARLIEQAFKDSWSKFKELLQSEPGKTIHVYVGVANLGDGVYGVTQWNNAGECTVSIAPVLDEKILKSTAVHELFHCFQVGMGLALNEFKEDMEWLFDATATWSENFIYPDCNREHEYLHNYFNDLDNPLIAKYKRYGSYMLFYFLQTYLQDTSAVPNALKKAKTTSVSYVIPELVSDYNAAFYMFAGYNYNKEPLKYYKDIPSFPDIKASENMIIVNDSAEFDVGVMLEGGAMRYDIIDFTDDIDKVVDIEFKFAEFEERELGRRALIKIAGEWHEEDWSGINRRKFCRNEPSENVQQILLIHSIANLKGKLDYVYYIFARDKCDNSFNGNIHIKTSTKLAVNLNISSNYVTKEEIAFDEDENCYVVKKRQIDYTENGGIDTRVIVGPEWNEIDIGSMFSSFYAEGHLYEEYDSEKYRIITGNKEDGYHIILHPGTNNKKWVSKFTKMQMLGSSSFLIEKGEGINLYFSDIDVKPEEVIGKRLKGTRTMDISGAYGSGSATLEFDFELP